MSLVASTDIKGFIDLIAKQALLSLGVISCNWNVFNRFLV